MLLRYHAANRKGDHAMTFLMLLFATLNVILAIMVLNSLWPAQR
jgi:hypothetical protein